MANYVKISTYMSYLLRHHPETLELSMDKYGYVFVEELIEKINDTEEWKNYLTIEKLNDIVETNDKKRFAFNEDHTKIRASQGHSFYVDTLREEIPPNTLYHGTAKRFLDSILENGLKPMSREYVHLSKNTDTAFQVGLRHAKKPQEVVFLEVDTKAMLNDGLKFYISENGVWGTKEVPPKYIKVMTYTQWLGKKGL